MTTAGYYEQHRDKLKQDALEAYYRMKADPEKHAAYLARRRTYVKQYREKNHEQLLANSKERYWRDHKKSLARHKDYYEANRAKVIEQTKWSRRKSMCGITKEQYLDMLADQGGVCAICSAAPPPDKELCLDHDHDTGKARGILCHACNKSLGVFSTVERLESALRYLKGETTCR